MESNYYIAPQQSALLRQNLSPKAAQEYERLSDGEDKISEHLDCLKQLFVQSGKEQINLCAKLQQRVPMSTKNTR